MSGSRSRSSSFTFRTVAGLAAAGLLLSACGDDGGGAKDSGPADPDAEVTISTMYLPSNKQGPGRKAYLDEVARFEDTYPNITVDAQETKFDPETFPAMIAGETVPTVMHVPFTEPPGMIEQRQATDITEEFGEFENFGKINEQLLELAKDDEGKIYGVPIESYELGLAYNRDLFEQAGLDPSDPPKTWDDVREAAKAISDKTDAAGYAMMTTDVTGGWMYTTMLYSFGGSIEEPDGDGYQASFNSAEGRQLLEYLQALRWEDNAMGDNFLLNQAEMRKEFAAGKVGMYIDGAFGLHNMVVNMGFDAANYGFSTLPQQNGTNGTLTGGAMAMISPHATPEERLAGLKWIDFHYLGKYFDEQTARGLMAARAEEGQVVGVPQLEPIGPEQTEVYRGWFHDLVNIPLENFEPYTSAAGTIPLIAEPPVRAQEVYAALDSMIQGALTREDADVDQLLGDAESKVNNILSR